MKAGFWSRLRLAGLKLLIITYEAGGSVWVEEAFTRGVGRGLVYHLSDLEGLGLIRVERRQYGIGLGPTSRSPNLGGGLLNT